LWRLLCATAGHPGSALARILLADVISMLLSGALAN